MIAPVQNPIYQSDDPLLVVLMLVILTIVPLFLLIPCCSAMPVDGAQQHVSASRNPCPDKLKHLGKTDVYT